MFDTLRKFFHNRKINKYLNLIARHGNANNEAAALKTIKTIYRDLGAKFFSNDQYRLSLTFDDKYDGKGTILAYAVHLQWREVAAQLIEWGVPIDSGYYCKTNLRLDNISPLIIACGQDDETVELLLKHGANIEHLTSHNRTILFYTATRNTFDLFVRYAKDPEVVKKLILVRTKSGAGVLEYLVNTDGFDLLNYYLAPEMFTYLRDNQYNFKSTVESIREAYFEKPENAAYYEQLINLIRPTPPLLAPVPLLADAKDIDPKTVYSELFEDKSSDSHMEALRFILADLFVLFRSPNRCIDYLRFLNAELARYFVETHHQPFPALDSSSYDFTLIDNTYYPIPKENYSGIKKHSALQKYLIILLNQHGLGKRSYKWYGFIPSELANTMIQEGDFIAEGWVGSGVFHHKLTHMLQMAMMLYAIECGDIPLTRTVSGKDVTVTLRDVLKSFLTMPLASKWQTNESERQNAWHVMRDFRNPNAIIFADPHRLGSVIIHNGHALGMPHLADSLTDTFCKGFNKQLKLMNGKSPEKLTPTTFVAKIRDIPLVTFFAPKYMIKQKFEAKSNSEEKANVATDFSYAIVAATYNPNRLFVPKRYVSSVTAGLLAPVKGPSGV